MKFRIKRNILNTCSAVIVTLTIIFCLFALVNVVFNFVYIRTPVTGFSMLPTLNSGVPSANIEGDTVFINKYSKLNINDIVVANVDWKLNLDKKENYIIKRLVGLPGDRIKITINKDENTSQHFYNLYNNDKLIYQKPVNSKTMITYNKYINYISYYNLINKTHYDYILVKENECFLVGDNWGASTDCFEKGALNKNTIVGKVDFYVPYKQNPIPYVFNFLINDILF